MPVIDVERVAFKASEGRLYLDDGLIVQKQDDGEYKIVGRWDPVREEAEAEDEEDGDDSREAAEPDEDVILPDPDDDELWRQIEEESDERLKDQKRAGERFTFARRYDYPARIERHASEFRDSMRGLASELREGKIGYGDWTYRSQTAIIRYTIDGYRLGLAQGRGVAPSGVKLTQTERKAAVKSAEGQLKHFAGFRDKVKGQIAASEPLTTALDTRAGLYGGTVIDAAAGARLAAEPDRPMRWRRREGDSCPTCIAHAGKVRRSSEWTAGDIWPSHNVQCDGNCRCSLEPEDGTGDTG